MKIVVYNVTRYKRDEIYEISGIGYTTEKDLIIACISKNGKSYINIVLKKVKNFNTLKHHSRA